MTIADEARQILATLGVAAKGTMECRSPIDGQVIGSVIEASAPDVEGACAHAQDAFLQWRLVQAPRRGELTGSSIVRFQFTA